MASSSARKRKTSVDVIVWAAYLASFVLLLYASTTLFGENLLTLTFGGFLVGIIGVVAVAYRTLYG